MKRLSILLTFLFVANFSFGQMIHDFTITDSDGVTHQLYADYLNQGKIVMLKFFFSTCPPCNTTAPAVQTLYEKYESQGDVVFITLSTKTWDSNNNAAGYKSQHGLTFPVAGNDGGAYDAALPFIQGTYGTFFGTPSYAVVMPDGSLNHPISGLNGVENIIDTALANMGGQMSSSVGVGFLSFKNGSSIEVEDLSVIMKPKNSSSPVVDIMALTGGSLSFEYPSSDFPEMNDPVIVVSSTARALTDDISPIDIVTIKRHILQLSIMNLPFQTMAADVNGDGKISGQDVVALNKVILEINQDFPAGVPSYQFLPAQLDVTPNPGGNVEINFSVLKMGDTSIN